MVTQPARKYLAEERLLQAALALPYPTLPSAVFYGEIY